MSQDCTHDCSSCSSNCDERTEPKDKSANYGGVKKVIAVMSGKGGVGKSLVTSVLACNAARKGLKTAIIDADITGPSVPKSFGIKDEIRCDEEGEVMYPCKTDMGIKIISMNLLMDNETDPVIWRGPIIAGAVKQFWEDASWGDIDCMFIDCPPGTGDVPLTVLQSLPIAGIVIVTSPQELVSMIVAKAVKMAKMMDIPIIGIVENMSYFECPDCGKKHQLFGDSHIENIAAEYGIETVAKLPIASHISSIIDNGEVEKLQLEQLDSISDKIIG